MSSSEVYGDQETFSDVVEEYLTPEFEAWWGRVAAPHLPEGEPPMPVDFAKALCAMAWDGGRKTR